MRREIMGYFNYSERIWLEPLSVEDDLEMLRWNRDALKAAIMQTGKLGEAVAEAIAENLCFIGTWSEPFCRAPNIGIDYVVRRSILARNAEAEVREGEAT